MGDARSRARSCWPSDPRAALLPAVLKVAPNAGDALLFYNFHPNMSPDKRALHGGCPVKEGEKHIVTRWIRMTTFS